MATPSYLSGCVWTPTSGGTGTWTVSAAVAPYFTPAQCTNPAVADATAYNYFAINGTEYEIGQGIYTMSGATLTRPTIYSSSNGGAVVNFSAAPTVYMGAPLAGDFSAQALELLNDTSYAAMRTTLGVDPAGTYNVPSGSIIQFAGLPSSVPSGLLLCTGENYTQASKPDLYTAIGGKFSRSTNIFISAKPWKNRYNDSRHDTASLGSWTTGTSLPGALGRSQAIVTQDRVYLLGGFSGVSAVATVYTAPINSDGTLGSWTTGTSLPGVLGASQAIVTKDRVYLLGGNNSLYTATVYTAPINSDGTLGSWTTGTSLPGVLGFSQAIVTKDWVYLLGGYSSGYTATVYTAPINSDGTLGSWTTGTSLPGALSASQAIVTKDRVYLLGGYSGVNSVATVYTAPINSDGTLGSWTTGTSLPGILSDSQAIVTKDRVYLFGGFSSAYIATVYTAPINSDGTLGYWTTGTSLPGVLGFSQAIVTKDRVYLLGGNNSSYTDTVYTGSLTNIGTNDYLTGTTLETYIPVTGGGEFAIPILLDSFDAVGNRIHHAIAE